IMAWANSDNAVLFYLHGDTRNCEFRSPYFEDVDAAYSGEKMFDIGSNARVFLVTNPVYANIETVFNNPNNIPFIVIGGHTIYFYNAAPSVYGGVSNLIDSLMVGWRLEGSNRRVLNIFSKGRADKLWCWQDTTDWKTICALYGDGKLEALGFVNGEIYRDDYGGSFANFTPPIPKAPGHFFFAEDTNSTSPKKRLYVCLDGSTWSYVDLT
ncbi:hypothetical protein DRN84_04395, partial [Candidatus Geothermarchaeota archaeon]